METQTIAERQLAQRGIEFRPEQLRKLADRLACCLNPDGIFTDTDRARRRGLTLGKQDNDGMSRLGGRITPEACDTLEAVLAKLAAIRMCNTLLPMSDVARLARHAHHYLAIFEKGRAIGLYHTKRLSSLGQRIALHAKDRGCSAPGCEVPGYLCEVHHVDDYAVCRMTG